MEVNCVQCGSEATSESINEEAPLCEEHDSKMKRERVVLRKELDDVAEQRKTMNLHMSPSASEATRDHAKRRMHELNHRAEDLRSRMADLQGRCDHPDLKEDRVRGEVVSRCPDCGYNKTEEWSPEPAELREGEEGGASSHASRNIEQIRQAERDGDIDPSQADEAVERILDGR